MVTNVWALPVSDAGCDQRGAVLHDKTLKGTV